MSLPYFPYYAKDFQAKVMHLTFAEEGVYIRLLRQCWFSSDGTLPADESWIFRKVIARSEEDKHTVRTILDEFFTKEKGRYFNSKLLQIMEDQTEAHAKRVNAGKKGGKSKSLKTNVSKSSNAKAMPKQPEPEPEPSIISLHTRGRLKPDLPREDFLKAVSARWNAMASDHGFPMMDRMTQPRIRYVRTRLAECDGHEETILRMIDRVPQMTGWQGGGKRDHITFDWMLGPPKHDKPDRFLEATEYNPKSAQPKARHDRPNNNRYQKSNELDAATRIALESVGNWPDGELHSGQEGFTEDGPIRIEG